MNMNIKIYLYSFVNIDYYYLLLLGIPEFQNLTFPKTKEFGETIMFFYIIQFNGIFYFVIWLI